MAGKKSTIKAIVDRNVERHLVKEFLMKNTKRSGLADWTSSDPNGTEVPFMLSDLVSLSEERKDHQGT